MPEYNVISSNASNPCFFDRNHQITESDRVKFDYDKTSNPDGIYAWAVIEAENEFQAGIKFAQASFDDEALVELIDLAIDEIGDCNEISEDLADLIERLNRFLPQKDQRLEGEHFGIN